MMNASLTAAGTPRKRLDRRTPFWDRVQKTDTCWLWMATKSAYGYGVIRRSGKLLQAHRVAYEELTGPIPDGMQLDHLCRNHACVNPAHLEPVTQRINLLRGETVTARNAAATHCPKGHPYDIGNTAYYTRGKGPDKVGRYCKTCKRDKERERRRHRAASREVTA